MKKKLFNWNNFTTKSRSKWTEEQVFRHWERLQNKLNSLMAQKGRVRVTKRNFVTEEVLGVTEIGYYNGLWQAFYDLFMEEFDRSEFSLELIPQSRSGKIRTSFLKAEEELIIEDVIGKRVYFFLVRNAIKCGTAVHPEVRFGHVQTSNDCPVKMLGYLPGSRKLEKQIHEELKPWQGVCQNEWFKDCLAVREIIGKYLKKRIS